jgi:hypothetical protein
MHERTHIWTNNIYVTQISAQIINQTCSKVAFQNLAMQVLLLALGVSATTTRSQVSASMSRAQYHPSGTVANTAA